MAPLSTQPVVILDEFEAIMIDDESEDEVEILEYGCPAPVQSSPVIDLSSDSPSSLHLIHTHQQITTSTLESPAVELPDNNTSLASSNHLPRPSVSSAGQTLRTARAGSTIISAGIKPLSSSKSRSSSPDLSSKASLSHSSLSRRSVDASKHGSSTLPVESREIVAEVAVDGQSPQATGKSGRNWPRLPGRMGGCSKSGAPPSRYVIDLDELENFDDLWNDEKDLQILRVEQRRKAEPQGKSSKTPGPKRNPPIVAPFIKLQEWKHKTLALRSWKAVELYDGDFLLIMDIIQHSTSGEVTLRGQRLQRCRSMNGLLEKKLNEVCFFHEVDLDDPRPPHEQSAVEVSVNRVVGLRRIRKTNQAFPLCRSLDLDGFSTQEVAFAEGGLTGRWKYTCTYASAVDRWNNNPKERTLEIVQEDECTSTFGVSNRARRFDWRGETVPGGAYRPDVENRKQLMEGARNDSIISLASSTLEPDLDCIVVDSPITPSEEAGSVTRNVSLAVFNPPTSRKRRASSLDKSCSHNPSTKGSKKMRFDNGDEVEITRQELSELTVEEPQDVRDDGLFASSDGYPLDAIDASLSCQSQVVVPPGGTDLVSTASSQDLSATRVPATIDLSSSDLATPGPSGSIRSNSTSEKVPVTRLPGQMLTYGDAFCGAGGTSRGATMAGLRVLWGFDHWNYACSTWRANFPQATCYELSSQDFVLKVQGARYRKSVDSKVDILHLSPPCQYFSPAHTVDCPNDEMNVASLFAVGPVIKVAKPRIVTLEQTFGIVAARFRNYFNSLIQMFTALSFSVRWAIVPLAEWGLPQRRYRLIIIASCPGEILPMMPSPTHSDSSDYPDLPPFNTVNETLSNIPDDAPHHDPASLIFPPGKTLRPWDGNAILPRAMTTSGGQNYHPSGTRDFTLREYAALQGFPPNHIFTGSYVKKQIGNAVPPVVAKVLFESIKKQLDKSDGVVEATETMVID